MEYEEPAMDGCMESDFEDEISFKVGRIVTPQFSEGFDLLRKNMENIFLDQNLDFMILLDGEFNYESNGSFRSKNGAITKKLWPFEVAQPGPRHGTAAQTAQPSVVRPWGNTRGLPRDMEPRPKPRGCPDQIKRRISAPKLHYPITFSLQLRFRRFWRLRFRISELFKIMWLILGVPKCVRGWTSCKEQVVIFTISIFVVWKLF